MYGMDELQRILEEGDITALTLNRDAAELEKAHSLFGDFVDELARVYDLEEDRDRRRELGRLRTDAILMMGDLNDIIRPVHAHSPARGGI